MPTLSDINVQIKTQADLEGIDQFQNSINKMSDETESKVSAMSKSTAAVMGLVAGAAQSLVYSGINLITSSIGSAIDRVDTLDNSSKVFANLGFKAGDVKQAMSELDTSIRGLPTSLNDAVTGMENLALQNGNIVVARKEFTAMNDGVLSAGGSTAQLNNAIQQITQLDMKGPLDAATWDSLRQSGLAPAMKAMADMSGVSMATLKTEFGNGTLKVQDFMDMLQKLDTQGAPGMASLSQQAKDMTSGIGTGIENAKTAINRGIADILKAIGTGNIASTISGFGKGFEDLSKIAAKDLPIVVDKIKQVYDQVAKYLQPSFDALKNTINKDLMPALEKLWNNALEPLVKAFGSSLVVALKLSMDMWNAFLKVMTPVINFMASNQGVVYALVGAFIALKTAMLIDKTVSAFKTSLDTAGTAMNLLKTGQLSSLSDKLLGMSAGGGPWALLAAAGVTAGVLIIQKWQETNQVVAQMSADIGKDIAAINGQTDQMYKQATDLSSKTKTTLEDVYKLQQSNGYSGGNKVYKTNGNTYTVGFATGGYTGQGGENEVAGIVHKGEYVVPKSQVDQTTGQPKQTGGNTNHFHGNIVLGDSSAVMAFFKNLDQDTILAGRGLTPNRGLR